MDDRLAMLDAAEALFAARGIGAVALHEVATAAGQADDSALRERFGSSDGLLLALLEHRMGPINDHRQSLVDGFDGTTDVRTVVEALVLPIADAVTTVPTSTYARFLARVIESDLAAGDDDEAFADALRDVLGALGAALDDLEPELRVLRSQHAIVFLVHGLAAWEHNRALGRDHADPNVLVTDLVDTIVGLLTAPSTVVVDRREPDRSTDVTTR